jgi:hypothetical protein
VHSFCDTTYASVKTIEKIFDNKTIYLILILTNDKIISAAENSKQK